LKEKWTPALRAQVQGVQPYLSYSQGATLAELIRDNPILSQPDQGGPPPDPFAGEKNYGIGLDMYFSRKYAEAEKAFTRAIEADNHDARYYYYLGLARLAQSNTGGAVKAFNAGARLELQSKPNSTSIANSLERVQGSPRQMINAARERARE